MSTSWAPPRSAGLRARLAALFSHGDGTIARPDLSRAPEAAEPMTPCLPLHRALSATTHFETAQPSRNWHPSTDVVPSVLVVPSRALGQAHADFITELGARAEGAATWQVAESWLKTKPGRWSAVILDVEALGGAEAVGRIRARIEQHMPQVRVICLSQGHDLPESIADCTLVRPFSLQQLEVALDGISASGELEFLR